MTKPGTRRRWSDLNGVERVGLYTRQSLYLVLLGFNGLLLVPVALRLDDRGEAVALLSGGAVVTALGFAAAMAVLRRFPAVQPLPWRRIAALLIGCGIYYAIAATAWTGDARGAAVTSVVATLTLTLGLLPGPRLPLALLALSGLLFWISGGEPTDAAPGLFFAATFLVTARASMWLLGIVTDLDVARQAQAQLAVVEERLRFSRDVHDVLGRRLSTIAVQAELAATLAKRGDARAAERMLEVRGVAHEALREARELARGYRSTDFHKELEGARSLLRSAGIEVRLSVDAMPRAWHEAAGWVVLESVTNVLRHSDARLVDIAYADGELRVDNDGAHPGGSSDGSGLCGLRERLSPLGASLVAQPDGGDRWTVVARFPGSGPLSATDTTGFPA
ncbi:histidine kinase [Conexibacter stalactiti]|uniref:Histidine kinase n=1 Tax=Conexibacter stalactiti TaxID=1940611 RepID=A0ABU4HX61_9ACTN|nr:histidine kinase [Conexibacter stalactiti]MDW5597080.1 histidine kinase [Conexibacter stalactiti]MEC5037722.1 histidine kinase [Conexibacter stalactiti]